jgi:hypothetical protein
MLSCHPINRFVGLTNENITAIEGTHIRAYLSMGDVEKLITSYLGSRNQAANTCKISTRACGKNPYGLRPTPTPYDSPSIGQSPRLQRACP